MATGKRRTSFTKLARDRELADKRARKEEKRAARRLAAGDASTPEHGADQPADPRVGGD